MLTVVYTDCVETVASEVLYVFSVVVLVVFVVSSPGVVLLVINAVVVDGASDVEL